MPKALPINPDLVRALFSYNHATGNLTTKPLAAVAARRINSKQWEFGAGTYSMHRIVWAYHNPDNANPKYIKFKDGNSNNPRIENLIARSTNPRWDGHIKKIDAEFDEYGRIVTPSACVVAANGALIPKHLITAMSEDDLERFGLTIEK